MRDPISFVYGNCVFGSGVDDPWAVFALETRSYEALSPESKRELFGSLMGAIEAVEADFQILRVGRPWNPGSYAEPQAEGGASDESALLGYLATQRRRLTEIGSVCAAPFMAVSLREPDRDVAAFVSDALASRPGDWLASLRRGLAWRERGMLDPERLEQLRVLADQAHARLADFLDVRPVTVTEVQWLVRRAFCRGLGEPRVDGLHEPRAVIFERNGRAVLVPLEADVMRWMEGYVQHQPRSLMIESELGRGYQAQLVAGALPERVSFPSARVELMFATAESLPFPVDLTLTARYLPNALAVRITRRRIQDADQVLRAEADGEQGATDQGYDRTQQARDLLTYLQSPSHPPLLRASLAVAVGAATPSELERRVELCRRAFGDVRLHRPPGDQLALFCQHLPGQRTRVRGYDDTLTPEQTAAMMPTATHAVGSAGGFYLGHTLSGSRQPVFFNLREGSDSDRNTAILSVGALGSGKTTLAQKLKYEGFLMGARIVDCDPKGDHRFHLLDEVAAHAETIVLRPESELRGILDPLRVAPPHLRQEAATAFLLALLPARSEATWETAIVRAVDTVVRRARHPNCQEVVRALGEGDDIDTHVAKTLAVYAESGLTQLCFAQAGRALPAVGGRQVTYISIRDLPGPEPGRPRGEYSQMEKIGEQLVRLIAMFAMHLMASERDRLKVFSFDEGWRLLGDPTGRSLLASLQRMGRSELAVPIISTQLVSDLAMDGWASLENLIGATFVFGMRSDAEAASALDLIGIDREDRRMRARLLDFDAGRCLFRDHRGRVEAIQVEVADRELLRSLSTTPAPAGGGPS